MKPAAYLFTATLFTSAAFVALAACSDSSSGGGTAGSGGSSLFGGGGSGGTTVVDEPAGKAGTGAAGKAGSGAAGKAGSTSSQGAGGDGDTFGGVGGSDGTAGKTSTQGGGGTSADDCETCVTTSCGTELDQCQNKNPDCAAILTCLQNCASGDSACQQKCVSDNPKGSADFTAAGKCVQSSESAGCADACGSTGSGGSGGGDDCATCQQTNCATEINACLSDTTCKALNTCVSKCSDQNCANTCASQNQAGVAKYQAAGTCVQNNCKTECASN